MATEKTDVVIVGVGAAGGILAAELGKAGMKVIGLERGPRLKTADFIRTTSCATSSARICARTQAPAGDLAAQSQRARHARSRSRTTATRRAAAPCIMARCPGACTKTISAPARKPSSATGQPAIPAGFLVHRLAVELCGSRAVLRPRRIRARRLRQGRQSAGPEDRRRQCVRGAAPARISAAAAAGRPGGHLFRTRRAKKLGYHPFSSPRAIISQTYHGRPACTYCGFCQAFGCQSAPSRASWSPSCRRPTRPAISSSSPAPCATASTATTADASPACRYYGPDGSDNTIEAELVILAPFIYDNTRLLLLSKTDKFPNGLANSSGQVGKHIMAHIGARVFATFDDRHVNIYMGPSAQKHSLDDFNADNFDHGGLGFIRGAQISVVPADLEGGPIGTAPCQAAARRADLGRRAIAISRQVLHPPCRHRRADREPALCGPDHRSRPRRARCLGPAGAAHDL